MRAELWWPTLFQDVKEFFKRCVSYQRDKVPIHLDEMPLGSMMGARSTVEWEIDFVGLINPLVHRQGHNTLLWPLSGKNERTLPRMLLAQQLASYMSTFLLVMVLPFIEVPTSSTNQFSLSWTNSW